MLGVVGFGFDAEDCSVDVLELLGECQLNQEFGGGAWREGANCGAGRASHHATKDDRSETIGGVEGGGEVGCELESNVLSFSVVHVDIRGWTEGA